MFAVVPLIQTSRDLYLKGCVLIEARDLIATHAAVAALPTRGRRLHFNNGDNGQKRILRASIAELPRRRHHVGNRCRNDWQALIEPLVQRVIELRP